ncbi:MAG: HAD family hydrolase [Candidatus Binataceae bacterium]
MATIDAFLFDFGGTLDCPRHWLDRFHQHYRTAGVDVSRRELDRAFEHAMRIAYRRTGEMRVFGLAGLVAFLIAHQIDYLLREAPREVRGALEHAGPHGREKLRDRVESSFVQESLAGFGRSRAVLEGLRRRFRIAVVSNFYGNLDRVLADGGLTPFVDAAIDSSLVGFAKPDPRIFKAALNAIGVDASNAVMVGDSLDKDCAPARLLGIRTVWLCTNGAFDSGVPAADRTIAALDELPGISW